MRPPRLPHRGLFSATSCSSHSIEDRISSISFVAKSRQPTPVFTEQKACAGSAYGPTRGRLSVSIEFKQKKSVSLYKPKFDISSFQIDPNKETETGSKMLGRSCRDCRVRSKKSFDTVTYRRRRKETSSSCAIRRRKRRIHLRDRSHRTNV